MSTEVTRALPGVVHATTLPVDSALRRAAAAGVPTLILGYTLNWAESPYTSNRLSTTLITHVVDFASATPFPPAQASVVQVFPLPTSDSTAEAIVVKGPPEPEAENCMSTAVTSPSHVQAIVLASPSPASPPPSLTLQRTPAAGEVTVILPVILKAEKEVVFTS